MKDTPLLVAASLLLASFVLDSFIKMYALPVSHAEELSWLAWVLGVAGIIMFVSAIVTHSKKQR